jgi:uncharacterized protein YbaR (Trm112 family)
MSSTENRIKFDLVQDASDESVGYEPKGYAFINEKVLICPSCDKKLVSLVLVKENNSPEQTFQANHLTCKTKSFKVKITGYHVIGQALPPYNIVDIDTIPNVVTNENYTEFMVK